MDRAFGLAEEDLCTMLAQGRMDEFWARWSALVEDSLISVGAHGGCERAKSVMAYKGHGRARVRKEAVCQAPRFTVNRGQVDADVATGRKGMDEMLRQPRRAHNVE
eukprot:8998133-Alexandrium_andersonii.AAC.1